MNDSKLTTSLSAVHQLILDRLSSGEWVSGEALLRLTGQSYYDRRVRELREEGWSIPYEKRGKEPGYRLASRIKEPGKKRTYPTAKQRREVLQRDNYTCQLCGLDMSGENPPSVQQIDHKVPLLRNGETTVENLQVLCSECNVVKRGTCRHCTRTTCEGCVYAYPGQAGRRITIIVPPDLVWMVDKYKERRDELERLFIEQLRKLS